MADTDFSSYILRYDLIGQVPQYFNGANWYPFAAIASGVSSLNTLTGAVVLAAGSGITLTPSGNTITINSTGSSSNFSYFLDTTPFTTTSATAVPTGTSVTHTAGVGKTVEITVSGEMETAAGNLSGISATLYKDGVQLPADRNAYLNATNGSDVQAPCSFIWLDVPGDTNPHTYTVYIYNDDGATIVSWLGSTGAGVIIAKDL